MIEGRKKMNIKKDMLIQILKKVAVPKPPWYNNQNYNGETSITHQFMYSQWKEVWKELGLGDYDEYIK